MAEQVTDVKSSSSEDPNPSEIQTDTTGSSAVTTDGGAGESDRPFGNYKAEVDRKLTKVERQIGEIAAYLGAMQQVAPKPREAEEPREYSDAELLSMARAGSDEAMSLYVQRKVSSSQAAQASVDRADLLVKTQLASLYRAYPVLIQDASHPLTQAAVQAKRLLMANGYPEGYQTDLEAAKTAIADYPDLAANARVGSPRVSEDARRGAVTTQQDVEGRTVRRGAAAQAAEKISDRSVDLANRYGVRDPKKARERFWKNQSAGKSSVSPTLSILLREET